MSRSISQIQNSKAVLGSSPDTPRSRYWCMFPKHPMNPIRPGPLEVIMVNEVDTRLSSERTVYASAAFKTLSRRAIAMSTLFLKQVFHISG